MTDRQPLATAMTEKLLATGELTDPAWQQAFTDTPRHIFVPDHGLADAYSLTALVTQWRTVDELGNKRPTSSASAPGAVAVMLERLNVQDHHRVLEIGTGTGYKQRCCVTDSARRTSTPTTSTPHSSAKPDARSTLSATSPH